MTDDIESKPSSSADDGFEVDEWVDDDLHADPPLAGGEMTELPRRRSRVVLYSSLSVAALIAVFIGVLATAQPSSSRNSSSPLLGKPAPAVAGPALNGGGSYSLSQFIGKWVVVNFSASWCVPCRQETPELQAFATEHAVSGNATVLAVSFDTSDVSHLAAYFRSVHATWPAINDPSAEVGFGVSEIPQSYLVDPAGTVVAKFFGEVTAAGVDKVINKATTAA